MDLPRSLSLPADVLAWAVARENTGELHPVLASASVWRPRDAEEAQDARAAEHLDRAGLSIRDQLDPDFRPWLEALCHPGVEYHGWISHGSRTIGVLAAATRQVSVLAVRCDGQVVLRKVSSRTLPETLVEQMPTVAPGSGDALTVLRSDIAGRPDVRESPFDVGTRSLPPHARVVRMIADLPVLGSGELHVSVRDSLGRKRSAAHPLRYADTTRGRWLNQVTPLADGDLRILVAPATRPGLAARLRDMHQDLT